MANSWTTDTTKSREQQKSLVLSLLPVAITSPLSLVLLTKILFFLSFFLSFYEAVGTELVTHMLTSCTHKHKETQALRCLLNDFIPPTALPHPHLSSACRSDIVPTWI